MAAIAFRLGVAHGARLHKIVATTLPLSEPTGHRDNVSIAHLLQGVASHEREHTTGTIKDHLLRLVGDGLFYLQFKISTRDMNGARNISFIPLIFLTHVNQDYI